MLGKGGVIAETFSRSDADLVGFVDADGATPPVRVPIRLAESCDPADRELAARLWPRLSSHPGAARRALDGTPLTGEESAAALAGSAAAAHAAGDEAGARSLLDRAAQVDEAHPGYYGSALVALTRAMLESDALGRC